MNKYGDVEGLLSDSGKAIPEGSKGLPLSLPLPLRLPLPLPLVLPLQLPLLARTEGRGSMAFPPAGSRMRPLPTAVAGRWSEEPPRKVAGAGLLPGAEGGAGGSLDKAAGWNPPLPLLPVLPKPLRLLGLLLVLPDG